MPSKYLTPPEAFIRQKYLQLVGEIDSEIRRISSSYDPTFLQCKPGCYECCINFSVFSLEASLISEQIILVSTIVESREDLCRLLKNNRCTVYEVRPIICRTQGIPLGYIDEDSGMVEVSACHHNYAVDYQFKEDEILFMDRFNNRLTELNNAYCKSVNVDPYTRIPLSSLIS